MAQAAAPVQTISASDDSYVLIDSVPEYEKKNVRIQITSDDELLASIKLQKDKKCQLFYGTDEIYIDELAGSEKTAFLGTITGKTTQGKTTYIVRNIGVPTSSLYSTKELKLLFKKITRTPIFSKLAPVPAYVNTEESIYLSGIKTGKKDDDISIKEQSNVLDEAHLKEIRNQYQAKGFFGGRTRPVHLYAKNVKTQQYEKVSFPKAAAETDPVPVLYLNPIVGKRADAEAKAKAELEKEIVDKAAELSLITAEATEYNAPASKARKTCAAFSKVIEADLTKNATTELEEVKKQKTELDAKKADPDYIKKTVQFGKEMSIDNFKREYVLIMSHKEWTVPGAQSAAPAPAPEPTGATVPGTVVPQQKFLGIFGGKRKTKRNDKKSRKGKSKKQAKSRKLFKGFLY
jgi:hypothetical protein